VANMKHILITDDEPLNLELMEEVLEDDFKVDCVSSGPECLNFLKKNKPDILLLDVAMPNMNGYQVCKTIKSDSNLNLPILFVSARGSIEERLAGYEAGGDDYLVKPFDNQELLAKVKSMLDFVKKQNSLNAQIDEANDITMMVMSNSGEIGHILNFLRQTFECNDLDSLTKSAFDTLKQFSLNGTLQYSNEGSILGTFDTSGIYKPVESELLQIAKQQGRIFNHNNRSIFNFKNASLLIKNMPNINDEKHGRLLDHLCMLMEGINARVLSIFRQQTISANAQKHQQILLNTQRGITEITNHLKKQKTSAINISQTLIDRLETDLIGLALDEDQETHLTTLVDQSTTKLIRIYDDQHIIDAFFNELINSLKQLQKK